MEDASAISGARGASTHTTGVKSAEETVGVNEKFDFPPARESELCTDSRRSASAHARQIARNPWA
eukprot:5042441-Prymnesium_polylepis.5